MNRRCLCTTEWSGCGILPRYAAGSPIHGSNSRIAITIPYLAIASLPHLRAMKSSLRYGRDLEIWLEFAEGVLLAECGTPPDQPLESSAANVKSTLAKPLDYPPLSRCTTPGDRICVALDQGIPQASEIAAAVVQSLMDAGVGADGISVLRTQSDAEAGKGDPRQWLDPHVARTISVVTHDPSKRTDIAYLAATKSGHSILLNRVITDADLVLPVGRIGNGEGSWDHGIHSAIFPNYSDDRTLMRYRSPSALNTEGRLKKAVVKEVDEVGWLLGVTLTIQVVPGPGDRILYVLAGEVDAVRRRGRELYQSAWQSTAPARASLVVAGIEGDCSNTWDAVGNALVSAGRLVEDGGAIALCCDLEGDPGPAIQRLKAGSSPSKALGQIRKERPGDALPATQLTQILERTSVYLLSRLDESLVDELGMVPLREPRDVARLAERHRSCIVLSNAALAIVTVGDS
jgi:nickel-dependent lactate racemase